jgi:predicted DCC family thiol-disulfide oxidoreductase YuxK
MRMIQRLMTDRIDARPMGVTRAAVGIAGMVMALELGGYLGRLADPSALRLPVLPAVEAMTVALWPVLIAAWLAACGAFAHGFRTRVAGAAIVALAIAFLCSDQQLYSNHLYLLTTVVAILTLADAGNGFAVSRHAETDAARWGRFLLRFQLSVVYAFSALAKLNASYLSGSVMASYLRSEGPLAVPQAWRSFDAMLVLSIVAILAEALLAIGLWLPKWRRTAFVVGLGLHLAILVTFDPPLPFLAFGILTLALYVQFLDVVPGGRLVIWDRSCSFCSSTIVWTRRLDWLGALSYAGNDEAAVLDRHEITREAADEAVHLVGPDGIAAGFEAVRRALEVMPIAFLWAPLLGLPPVRFVGDRVYRAVALRRQCRIQPMSPRADVTVQQRHS